MDSSMLAATPPRPWADLADLDASSSDPQPHKALDVIVQALMMDEEWTLRGPRTARWWAGPIPLKIDALGPRQCLGQPTVKVSFRVDILRDVTAKEDVVLEVLAARNAVASTGAFVWTPNERRIMAVMTHYSSPDTKGLDHLLPALALLMYTEALGVVHHNGMAELLGGTPAFEPHPTSGLRMTSDPLMQVTDQEVIPAGAKANAFAGPEVAGIPRQGGPFELFANADDKGCTAEFPFTTCLPASVAKALGQEPAGQTSMAQLLALAHPSYGQGLAALLHIPLGTSPSSSRRVANELNIAEFRAGTGFPAWGAWTTQGDRGSVTHATFIPNAYARGGLASALIMFDYLRSQWVQEQAVPADVVDQVRAGRR